MKQWDFLKGKFEAGQLGHAYIFSGQDVESLKKFANNFATFINCKFPDVFIVKSENSKSSLKDGEDKQEIDVALIRETQHFLSYKSYYGGYKTVIIENAERMNLEAQNCFLKNLEEPKGDTLIILLSSKPEMLLSTIFSRCQQIKFFSPVVRTALLPGSDQELLQVIEGDLAQKFKYAKNANLEGGGFENILYALQNYGRKDIGKYWKVLKLALDLERQVMTYNLNKKLALEIILLEL
ncbi:MAG: hypothetical protein A3C50_00785 [Candidatus Staskawiczbacteria bacterium RIFCSPHIGHO2_02_FULL_43_16]|uniref:DNA polymerase III subunit delta n=1 Tax=Candidatus Staskawiczbacteria bacterium RIFCSPHIGHO2_01_FULL_41_41 TaxID=1802203 RepID=A0A1G2HTV0_9BACT|nr:MAG: hypothetical protein A2822_00105 [Candidatus Staskawiczbacteria bacterium RIFCSPHIGHO2_01_FULL_41_41]OGZ68290.1 MAG: hypothetical protein A3C50_00785 [Candidatus Staskawiczbacteria bacterium RIFCSPHIGHO2_02_FULL_43_16]OGZ74679.1 MAG: hypothetical protein A3A12_00875 [Candidatus Staskawiczbacteria bacterium RIFCSPLOWO2_01_FULL_43_17b]